MDYRELPYMYIEGPCWKYCPKCHRWVGRCWVFVYECVVVVWKRHDFEEDLS